MSSDRPRKTFQELQHDLHGSEPMQIAGKPADVCPYCGCAMFAGKSTTLQSRVEQYRYCRNPRCGKKFFCYQPPRPTPTIIREIVEGEVSNNGTERLTVVRDSA